jgi:hypothetical protein
MSRYRIQFLLFAALLFIPARSRAEQPSARELEERWSELAGSDAAKAYRAIWSLVGVPEQSVPFLKEHLKPIPAVDAKRLTQLTTELDDQRFAVRKKATDELEKLADLAVPALQRILEQKPSLEVRQRVEKLLEKAEQIGSPDQLRGLRAIEALEHIATPDAQAVLQNLAKGAPGARITTEADASVKRLAKRQGMKR